MMAVLSALADIREGIHVFFNFHFLLRDYTLVRPSWSGVVEKITKSWREEALKKVQIVQVQWRPFRESELTP
jgi:hypothetical protein